MANEALVSAVKQILSLFREKREEEGFAAYGRLFSSPAFGSFTPQEQRQALKLMINIKVPPLKPAPHMVAAYKEAMKPLKALIAAEQDPADMELYGIAQIITGDDKGAADTLRKALQMERERNPQSDLCGSLMKWVAAV